METEGRDPALIGPFPPSFPLFPPLHSFIHLTSSYSILHGRSLEERMGLKLMFQAKGVFP